MTEAQCLKVYDNVDHVLELSYDISGQRMATSTSNGGFQVWDQDKMGNWNMCCSHSGYGTPIWKLLWVHPEYGYGLITCSMDNTITVWEEISLSMSSSDLMEDYDSRKIDTDSDSGADNEGELSLKNEQINKKEWIARCNIQKESYTVADIEFAPNYLGLILAICYKNGFVRIYKSHMKDLSNWSQEFEMNTNLVWSSLSWTPFTIGISSPLLALGFEYNDVEPADIEDNTKSKDRQNGDEKLKRGHDEMEIGIVDGDGNKKSDKFQIDVKSNFKTKSVKFQDQFVKSKKSKRDAKLEEFKATGTALESAAKRSETAKVVIYEFKLKTTILIKSLILTEITKSVNALSFTLTSNRRSHLLAVASDIVTLMTITPVLNKFEQILYEVRIIAKLDSGASPICISWNPLGNIICVPGSDGRIFIWKRESEQQWTCMSVIKADDNVPALHAEFDTSSLFYNNQLHRVRRHRYTRISNHHIGII